MFNASLASENVTLASPRLDTIIVALDESNQDATTEDIAAALAQRYGARLHLTCAALAWDEAKAEYLRERQQALVDRGLQATQSRVDGAPVEQILEVSRAEQGDLIVFCAPYLEDYMALGHESVGSNTDLLLRRSATPLLIVREPHDDVVACLRHVLCPLTQHAREDLAEASWALTALSPGGRLRIIGVADEEAITMAEHLVGRRIDLHAFDLNLLAGVEAPHSAGLIAALQRRSQEAHLGCAVTVEAGEFVARVAAHANAEPCLVVLGGLQSSWELMSQRLPALVRALRHPVLVV